jgi:hypothetical protein
MDDYWAYFEAVSRWNSALPPPRPIPSGKEVADGLPPSEVPRPRRGPRSFKSRHVGVRLTQGDFEMLEKLALAHAVRPGTMARMLIVRGVRAAADAVAEGD